LGHDCTVFSEKKFGTARAQTKNVVSRIAVAFKREKYSIGLSGLADR
jgi:hypothetical protein